MRVVGCVVKCCEVGCACVVCVCGVQKGGGVCPSLGSRAWGHTPTLFFFNSARDPTALVAPTSHTQGIVRLSLPAYAEAHMRHAIIATGEPPLHVMGGERHKRATTHGGGHDYMCMYMCVWFNYVARSESSWEGDHTCTHRTPSSQVVMQVVKKKSYYPSTPIRPLPTELNLSSG